MEYEATGDQNVGSEADPLCYADACECDGEQVATPEPDYSMENGAIRWLENCLRVALKARGEGILGPHVHTLADAEAEAVLCKADKRPLPEWAMDKIAEDTGRLLKQAMGGTDES